MVVLEPSYIRHYLYGFLASTVLFSSCLSTNPELRGQIPLKGTVYEGWVFPLDATLAATLPGSLVMGTYYSCLPSQDEAQEGMILYVCTLLLEDGEIYVGTPKEEKILITYKSSKGIEKTEIKPEKISDEESTSHFKFWLPAAIANNLKAIEMSAPVVFADR
jgi:hypothetical protein